MKQMLRKKDVWVLLAALIGAFACVTLIQLISGRIDGVASMVFLLAVFFVSMYTDGYWWGVAGSVISVLAVNFAFRTPYFAFNFTIPENIFSGAVTPSRPRPLARTARTLSASFSRAESTPGSSPLMRQAL